MQAGITTTYRCATATKGARLIAVHDRVSITRAYDHSLSAEGNHICAAVTLTERHNMPAVAMSAWLSGGKYVHVTA